MSEITKRIRKDNYENNIVRGFGGLRLFAILIALILIPITGCISKPSDNSKNIKNETPIPSVTTNVSPAPWQMYIKAGQHEQFTYWGHNITVEYISAYPVQVIKVNLDGSERMIRKELNDSPRSVYWMEANLSFNLKPVVWEERDTQMVPIYESTWNTSEVLISIRANPPAQIPGGPQK